MWQVLAIVLLISCNASCLRGQNWEARGCVPKLEFAPNVVENPAAKVTFKCKEATPLDLIRATAFQTRIPIGLAMGRDRGVLEEAKRSFDLQNVDARSALLDALRDTDYTIGEDNGVLVLMAGDMTGLPLALTAPSATHRHRITEGRRTPHEKTLGSEFGTAGVADSVQPSRIDL